MYGDGYALENCEQSTEPTQACTHTEEGFGADISGVRQSGRDAEAESDAQGTLSGLISRLDDEADLCRNEGADDVAQLISDAANGLRLAVSVVNYVSLMTCINLSGDWVFKDAYDPQVALDFLALAAATDTPKADAQGGVQ